MTQTLSPVLAENIRATNAHDLEALLATFAEDALILDDSREIIGTRAIRGFLAREIVGDHVTYRVTEVVNAPGVTIIRAITEGDFDRTGLPDPVILTHYFSVINGKISAQYTALLRESEY